MKKGFLNTHYPKYYESLNDFYNFSINSIGLRLVVIRSNELFLDTKSLISASSAKF